MKVTWTTVGDGHAASLEDPEAFDGFSVEVPDGVEVADLGLVAHTGSEREEVDVPVDLVRRLAGPLADTKEWTASLDRMLQAVTRFGWYDERTRLIRAHVVRV